MKKSIITIERQYGSGGSVIGRLAAEKLGINCYNRQILEMTAERCGISSDYLESAEEQVFSIHCSFLPIRAEQWRIIFRFPIRCFSWKAALSTRLPKRKRVLCS